MKRQRTRIYVSMLCICLMFSLVSIPASATETEQEANKHQHTEACYSLGKNCVHEHTQECYQKESASENEAEPSKAAECSHECSEESGCITKELSCQSEGESGNSMIMLEPSQENEAGEESEQEQESETTALSNEQENVTAETALTAPETAVMPVSYNGPAIIAGTSGINDPVKTTVNRKGDYWTPNSYIYFGINSKQTDSPPIKWRVLDSKKANDGATSGMFLFMEHSVAYMDTVYNDKLNAYLYYQGSVAQQWCNTFGANTSNFSIIEQSAMLGVSKTDITTHLYGQRWQYSTLTPNDKIFFLSAKELSDYVANYQGAPGIKAEDVQGRTNSWWLRSPFADHVIKAGVGNLAGYVGPVQVNEKIAARPALNLDFNAILFTSAASDGKKDTAVDGDLTEVGMGNSEWKLTLKDTSRNFMATVATSIMEAGQSIPVIYSGANTGDNEYVSAMIEDDSGTILYYGRIAQNSESGTADITIPSSLAPGKYTLKVFGEQYNGDYKTDYASAPQDISITVVANASGTNEVSTEAELVSALADNSISEIKMTGDIDISSTLMVNRAVTLDLNGFVLQMTNDLSVIEIESSGELTIRDSSPSVSHRFTTDSDGLWALDEANGTEMINGGVITGGVASAKQVTAVQSLHLGGGIYVAENGRLTMTAGNIVGCSAEDFGGGVTLRKNADFTMTGGSIVGCIADNGGGIICYNEASTIKMSGKSLIYNCRAKDKGGGVWILGELCMMDTAAIRSCISGYGGGGVFVNSSSSLAMSGNAVIEDCKAVRDSYTRGGGVYMGLGGSLTMRENSRIQNCSAEWSNGLPTSYGGGVSTYYYVRQIILEDQAMIDQGMAANKIGLYIDGNTDSGGGEFSANGGSVNGDVILGVDKWRPCTIIGAGRTAFNGTVTVGPGSRIEKGTFNGTVINNGTIAGGTFKGMVTNNDGTVLGGDFTDATLSGSLVITFDPDNGEQSSTQKVNWSNEGATLTQPDPAPAREGFILDGWYYDNGGTKTQWDFAADKIKYTMTLTAQWAESVSYIVEHYKAGDNGYTLEETENFTGKIGDTVTATQKNYAGFRYNPSVSTDTGLLKKSSSAADKVTLKLYYDLARYTVTVENDGNGFASAAPVFALAGEEITLTVTPVNGYQFKEWQFVSGEVTIKNNKFIMPACDVSVKAVFEEKTESSGDTAINDTSVSNTNSGSNSQEIGTVYGRTNNVSVDTTTHESTDPANQDSEVNQLRETAKTRQNGRKSVDNNQEESDREQNGQNQEQKSTVEPEDTTDSTRLEKQEEVGGTSDKIQQKGSISKLDIWLLVLSVSAGIIIATLLVIQRKKNDRLNKARKKKNE